MGIYEHGTCLEMHRVLIVLVLDWIHVDRLELGYPPGDTWTAVISTKDSKVQNSSKKYQKVPKIPKESKYEQQVAHQNVTIRASLAHRVKLFILAGSKGSSHVGPLQEVEESAR